MLSSVALSASFSSCSRKDGRKAASLLASRCHMNLKRKVAEWVWSHMGEVRLEVRQHRSQPSESDVLPLTCRALAFQCAPWVRLAGVSTGQGTGLCVKRALCRKCVLVASSHSLCGCFSFDSWNKYVRVCVFLTQLYQETKREQLMSYDADLGLILGSAAGFRVNSQYCCLIL